MNVLEWSVFMGRWAGINVRLHYSFVLVILSYFSTGGDVIRTALWITGLYLSILLHEFGHSLTARFCDGESEEIVLWPLGGLALCRTPFSPSAALITTMAGPFVTLVLWGFFSLASSLVPYLFEAMATSDTGLMVYYRIRDLIWDLVRINKSLLIFNLIPCFPMDGGKILFELIWFKWGTRVAGNIALTLSYILAGMALIIGVTGTYVPFFGITLGGGGLIVVAVFVILGAAQQKEAIMGHSIARSFSLKERLRRFFRNKEFFGKLDASIKEEGSFHHCAVCRKTEHDGLSFRVAADGKEYCLEHLPSRAGKTASR
jgi:Zn-dependent protease